MPTKRASFAEGFGYQVFEIVRVMYDSRRPISKKTRDELLVLNAILTRMAAGQTAEQAVKSAIDDEDLDTIGGEDPLEIVRRVYGHAKRFV